MSKGRKPKPTAILKAQGTYDASRHKNRLEADGTPTAAIAVSPQTKRLNGL